VNPWADIVGAANVTPGGPGDAVDALVPAHVVHPGSVAEVQACVRAGAALVASGRGAHLDLGAPPRRFDVLLRLDRLARVLAHDAGDMTVSVEAGCPLAVLEAMLGAAGQWLPLDPPCPETTTVGGLVAANLSGPLRASQGRVRDLLIGIRVVGADGVLVASGGRVVKNVAGYDLSKLHVGALGSVGVIVEATFKVRPRPPHEEAMVVACTDIEHAADMALTLLDSTIPPFWLELAGPGALADEAAVAIGLAGIAEEVAAARAAVGSVARARGFEAWAVTDGRALRGRLGGLAVAPAAAVLRAATLPSEVGGVMQGMIRGGGSRCSAHAANGVVRAAVEDAEMVPKLVRALRPDLEASGGSLVVERASAAVKQGLDVWGDGGPAFALMREIKHAFDPTGMFAPGRFVGGL
jgi:glycolate oxidase FAD binding subunit